MQNLFKKIMNTNIFFSQIKIMKLLTKIFFAMFIVTIIPAIVLSGYVFDGIYFDGTGLVFDFNTVSIVGLSFMGVSAIFGIILYLRFLKVLKLSKVLFFSVTPLTIIYGVSLFIISDLGKLPENGSNVVQVALRIETGDILTSILWGVLFTLIYLILLFVIFNYVCRPIQKIEKVTARLGDGRVKEDLIKIGKSNQFKKIQNSLEKINYNYKSSENLLRKTNLETKKFIPKQILKFLGKKSITELEIGNQIQKKATTLFCDLISSSSMSKTLSLEENFNFVNSYLNVISPIVRRHDGFIDKYLGDGTLAVFKRPESAIECAHSITKAIQTKNSSHKNLPLIETKISINTGELIFGIVGEEERKSPTIVSDVVNLASKMEDINKFLGTRVLISKETLNSLPSKYVFAYRHVGSMQIDKENSMAIFESLENYKKGKKEKLIKLKSVFENGVRSYNSSKFKQAKDFFQEILKQVSDDKPAYVYFNKCCEKLNIE